MQQYTIKSCGCCNYSSLGFRFPTAEKQSIRNLSRNSRRIYASAVLNDLNGHLSWGLGGGCSVLSISSLYFFIDSIVKLKKYVIKFHCLLYFSLSIYIYAHLQGVCKQWFLTKILRLFRVLFIQWFAQLDSSRNPAYKLIILKGLLTACILLSLSHNPSLLSITLGKSSKRHSVSAQSWWM